MNMKEIKGARNEWQVFETKVITGYTKEFLQ